MVFYLSMQLNVLKCLTNFRDSVQITLYPGNCVTAQWMSNLSCPDASHVADMKSTDDISTKIHHVQWSAESALCLTFILAHFPIDQEMFVKAMKHFDNLWFFPRLSNNQPYMHFSYFCTWWHVTILSHHSFSNIRRPHWFSQSINIWCVLKVQI